MILEFIHKWKAKEFDNHWKWYYEKADKDIRDNILVNNFHLTAEEYTKITKIINDLLLSFYTDGVKSHITHGYKPKYKEETLLNTIPSVIPILMHNTENDDKKEN